MFIVVETFSIKQRQRTKIYLHQYTKSHELRTLPGIELKITLNVCFSRRLHQKLSSLDSILSNFLPHKSGRRDFHLHTASSALMSAVVRSRATMARSAEHQCLFKKQPRKRGN